MTISIRVGDCREVMAEMDAASVDAIVTDPPYDLNFMGKAWDRSGVAFDPETWIAALRVLKPGGHLLAMGGTRTYHRMAVAIEDAGFEIRDCLSYLYGSGFPKSHNISKAIDKAAGAERDVVGQRVRLGDTRPYAENETGANGWGKTKSEREPLTTPATDLARQWDGFGTALKPSMELIVLARKPLIGTVAANVTAHGTGGLNIDGCRIGAVGGTKRNTAKNVKTTQDHQRPNGMAGMSSGSFGIEDIGSGRWPANVLLGCACDGDDHEPGCAVAMLDAQSGEASYNKAGVFGTAKRDAGHIYANGSGLPHEGQHIYGYGDTGGASRFMTVCARDTSVDCYDTSYDNKVNEGVDQCLEPVNAAVENSTQNPTMFDEDSGGTALVNADAQDSARTAKPMPGAPSERVTGDGIASGENPEAAHSISRLKADGPGNRQTDLSQTDTKSITATSIPPTTTSPIWNALPLDGMTNTTSGSERITDSSTESSNVVASDALNTKRLTNSAEEPPEPITAIASPVLGNPSANGGTLTENGTTPITVPIENGTEVSRFFYTAKSSRAERNKGLAGMPERRKEIYSGGIVSSDHPGIADGGGNRPAANVHPTVKPVSLMQWLVRLVTPPGGTVLDPFLGSGTTGIAADREGFHFIGIELSREYADIARQRITGDAPLLVEVEWS